MFFIQQTKAYFLRGWTISRWARALSSIRTVPDPILLKDAAPLSKHSYLRRFLIEKHMRFIFRHVPAAGLAAPQVGSKYRVFLLLPEDENAKKPLVFYNPDLISLSGKMEEDYEKCLSTPGSVLVPRSPKITITAENRRGHKFQASAEGFSARIIQHELDHLRGILMTQYGAAVEDDMS